MRYIYFLHRPRSTKMFLGRNLPSLVSENLEQNLLTETPRNLKMPQVRTNAMMFVRILGIQVILKI